MTEQNNPFINPLNNQGKVSNSIIGLITKYSAKLKSLKGKVDELTSQAQIQKNAFEKKESEQTELQTKFDNLQIQKKAIELQQEIFKKTTEHALSNSGNVDLNTNEGKMKAIAWYLEKENKEDDDANETFENYLTDNENSNAFLFNVDVNNKKIYVNKYYNIDTNKYMGDTTYLNIIKNETSYSEIPKICIDNLFNNNTNIKSEYNLVNNCNIKSYKKVFMGNKPDYYKVFYKDGENNKYIHESILQIKDNNELKYKTLINKAVKEYNKIITYQTTQNGVVRQIRKLKEDKESVEEELELKKNELIKINVELATLKETHDKLTTIFNTITNEKNELLNRVNLLTQNVSKKNADITLLTKSVSNKNIEIKLLSENAVAKKSSINILTTQLTDLNEQLTTLNKQLTTLQNELNETKANKNKYKTGFDNIIKALETVYTSNKHILNNKQLIGGFNNNINKNSNKNNLLKMLDELSEFTKSINILKSKNIIKNATPKNSNSEKFVKSVSEQLAEIIFNFDKMKENITKTIGTFKNNIVKNNNGIKNISLMDKYLKLLEVCQKKIDLLKEETINQSAKNSLVMKKIEIKEEEKEIMNEILPQTSLSNNNQSKTSSSNNNQSKTSSSTNTILNVLKRALTNYNAKNNKSNKSALKNAFSALPQNIQNGNNINVSRARNILKQSMVESSNQPKPNNIQPKTNNKKSKLLSLLTPPRPKKNNGSGNINTNEYIRRIQNALTNLPNNNSNKNIAPLKNRANAFIKNLSKTTQIVNSSIKPEQEAVINTAEIERVSNNNTNQNAINATTQIVQKGNEKLEEINKTVSEQNKIEKIKREHNVIGNMFVNSSLSGNEYNKALEKKNEALQQIIPQNEIKEIRSEINTITPTTSKQATFIEEMSELMNEKEYMLKQSQELNNLYKQLESNPNNSNTKNQIKILANSLKKTNENRYKKIFITSNNNSQNQSNTTSLNNKNKQLNNLYNQLKANPSNKNLKRQIIKLSKNLGKTSRRNSNVKLSFNENENNENNNNAINLPETTNNSLNTQINNLLKNSNNIYSQISNIKQFVENNPELNQEQLSKIGTKYTNLIMKIKDKQNFNKAWKNDNRFLQNSIIGKLINSENRNPIIESKSSIEKRFKSKK